MNDQCILELCRKTLGETPAVIERCGVGQGNYVYLAECCGQKSIIRCSEVKDAYQDTVRWLEKLSAVGVPVPKVIARGRFQAYEYLILSYLEGKDIGLVYPQLIKAEKREIAREVVRIQDKVSELEVDDLPSDWSWHRVFVDDMLERAENRILTNGYFDVEKVERLKQEAGVLDPYFEEVKPIAYLDDISTKNLLIHRGRVSGIIDVDWIGTGDRLTFAALTYVALMNMEYDTDYVEYLLEEMQVQDKEKAAFLFYSLIYCVDFMGERGMEFLGRTVEVNRRVIDRLNSIYDRLFRQWEQRKGYIK